MIEKILRYSDEPVCQWSDSVVHHILTRNPAHFVKEMLIDYISYSNIEVPQKQIFDDKKHPGDFRIMPCVIGDLKIVKIVGTNHQQNVVKDKITVGKALVLHPTDNYVTDIIDACALSSARTGAVIAIAAILLENSRKTTTIVGAGRVGYYAALYLCSIGEIDKMQICDLDMMRSKNVVIDLSSKFPDIEFEIIKSPNVNTDLIVTATDSQQPFLHPYNTNATTIISVGADEVNQRELHLAWISDANIFIESLDSMRYGDLNAWKHHVDFSCNMLNALDTNRNRDKFRDVFISTGSALFDNLAIKYILNAK